jgi:sigma-B regulation protein RsbU (phosphoserine phosphatase)
MHDHHPGATPSDVTQYPITVLLIDDQAMIAETIRYMIAGESDFTLHYCADPKQAIETAQRVQPTVILQDLVMPDVEGLVLLKFFRAHPATRDIPMIVLSSREEPLVKAEAFALGASDYLVKLPDRVELVARIRHHSRGYISFLQRNEAFRALAASRQVMAKQLDTAARYVFSLLPRPAAAPVRTDWRYVPCANLGGDTFGYHWIDDDHFALYLVDVAGHGVDAALLSVTIMNVLRSRALPNTDFRLPGQVLGALNEAFPMESYGEKCFTIWYGVYQKSANVLSWSGGGHPPALLFEEAGAEPVRLNSDGPMLGMMPWPEFTAFSMPVKPQARLYIYSDGVHEIHKTDGKDWTFDEFVAFMSQRNGDGAPLMDRLKEHVCGLHGSDQLDDDFSLVEAIFP